MGEAEATAGGESRNVWFDVDGGDLPETEWFVLFRDYQFLAFNSFNNGKDGAKKYRVVFSTSTSIRKEDYHKIWDLMIERIIQAGYFVRSKTAFAKYKEHGGKLRFSGIDTSKRCANSMFYLPSVAGWDGRKPVPKHSFWLENWDDKPMIEPNDWLRLSTKATYQMTVHPSHQNAGDMQDLCTALLSPTPDVEQQTSAAIDEWHRAGDGDGHNAFYRLGLSLRHLGLPQFDIRSILVQQCQYARHPEERRKEIDANLKSIMKR
jgi:hypothetical protein